VDGLHHGNQANPANQVETIAANLTEWRAKGAMNYPQREKNVGKIRPTHASII